MESNLNSTADKQSLYAELALNNNLKQCLVNSINDLNEIYPPAKSSAHKKSSKSGASTKKTDFLFSDFSGPEDTLSNTGPSSMATGFSGSGKENFNSSSAGGPNLGPKSSASVSDNLSQDSAPGNSASNTTAPNQAISCSKCHYQINTMTSRSGLLGKKSESNNTCDVSNIFLKLNKESLSHILNQNTKNIQNNAIQCTSCLRHYHRECHYPPALGCDLKFDSFWICSLCYNRDPESQFKKGDTLKYDSNISNFKKINSQMNFKSLDLAKSEVASGMTRNHHKGLIKTFKSSSLQKLHQKRKYHFSNTENEEVHLKNNYESFTTLPATFNFDINIFKRSVKDLKPVVERKRRKSSKANSRPASPPVDSASGSYNEEKVFLPKTNQFFQQFGEKIVNLTENYQAASENSGKNLSNLMVQALDKNRKQGLNLLRKIEKTRMTIHEQKSNKYLFRCERCGEQPLTYYWSWDFLKINFWGQKATGIVAIFKVRPVIF